MYCPCGKFVKKKKRKFVTRTPLVSSIKDIMNSSIGQFECHFGYCTQLFRSGSLGKIKLNTKKIKRDYCHTKL